MGVLTAIDVKDAPADVKVRHVERAILDAEGKIISTAIDTPEARYCWLVTVGQSKHWVSGDYHLPCIPGEECAGGGPDNPVATITKVNPKTGEVRYGPADVMQPQHAAWVAAGAFAQNPKEK